MVEVRGADQVCATVVPWRMLAVYIPKRHYEHHHPRRRKDDLATGDTKEEDAVSDEQVVPATSGVSVELLTTVDLGPEIPGMDGRQLRMRMVTIQPGGVFGPLHDHKGRPGSVYVLEGTITDHRNGIATEYGPGPGWPEDRNTLHWLENTGSVPAVEISVDIVTA